MTNWKLNVVYTNKDIAVKASNDNSPAMVVFNELLCSLFAAIETAHAESEMQAKFSIYTSVSKLKLPMKLHKALRDHFLHHKPLELRSVALDENKMEEIVQVLYEMMCELIGPVKADACISSAVTQARKIPEAAQFDPRGLL